MKILQNLVCNEEKLKTKLNKVGSRAVCFETRKFDENVQWKAESFKFMVNFFWKGQKMLNKHRGFHSSVRTKVKI